MVSLDFPIIEKEKEHTSWTLGRETAHIQFAETAQNALP